MMSCFRQKWQTKREKKNIKKSKIEENNNRKETETLEIDFVYSQPDRSHIKGSLKEKKRVCTT